MVIRPYFFDDERGNSTKVTSTRYVTMLGNFATEKLENLPGLYNPWFH
jgi:hypothetical protein